MKRRAFIQKISLTVLAGLASGFNRLFAGDSATAIAQGVPQPPQPPKPTPLPEQTAPQSSTPSFEPDPPPVKYLPTTPFDAPPGSWTLAVMPDTQNMSHSNLEEYCRQTEWIVAHQKKHNIIFVAHEGDVVDTPLEIQQWKNAQKAMRILTDAGIPYCLLPGNHDVVNDRFTLLNHFFSQDDYRHSEKMGLFEEGKMENSWHTFTAPTGQYLIVAIEWIPRFKALSWAGDIVKQHPDHKVIIVTHAYTDFNNTRLVFNNGETDGEDIWNKLVKKHPNIFLVLSGHVLDKGTGYLVSIADHGQRVHQILANYQAAVQPHGGGGYLRLMQFYPDGETVQVKSYSPWLDHWLLTPDQQFKFTI